jgi:hypothetical protein
MPLAQADIFAERWERVRQKFAGDLRAVVGDLAAKSKINWPVARWQHPLSDCAKLTWPQLQSKITFGLSKQRGILKILERDSKTVSGENNAKNIPRNPDPAILKNLLRA